MYSNCKILRVKVQIALILLGTLLFFKLTSYAQKIPQKKYNVLFIASDDLNSDMSCYGNKFAKTPNLDALAAKGVKFEKAYNQYPWCAPSRASILTGQRPDSTKVYDLETNFRTALPNVVTLPQLFKNNGYYSARVGKIFHYGVPDDIGTNGMDDAASWTERRNPIGIDKTGEKNVTNYTPNRFLGSSLSFWATDEPDDQHTDGKVCNEAIDMMTKHKDEPFFMAVGFFRPHCPFIAPKKYFDMYPIDQIVLPEQRENDWDAKPESAKWNKQLDFGLPVDKRKEVLQAYYASISFMDAQVGKLMSALDSLGLSENTIVVFWSDHGYNVGQHGQWMKESLFEHVARTPLMMYAPHITKGKACDDTVEMLDIYPTLAELCGLNPESPLHGKSLAPLLKNPKTKLNQPAYTQVFRGPNKWEPNIKPVMGRSVRTSRWRYTEWNQGEDGAELYDYKKDPNEFDNLAHNKRYKNRVIKMKAYLTR